MKGGSGAAFLSSLFEPTSEQLNTSLIFENLHLTDTLQASLYLLYAEVENVFN